MEMNMIRILLADSNKTSRSALALMLQTRFNASIVGEASTMESLLDWAAYNNPEVADTFVINTDSPEHIMAVLQNRSET